MRNNYKVTRYLFWHFH